MLDTSFFDTVHDRRHTGSIKYGNPPIASASSVIPMWIADMDFRSPPAVTDALSAVVRHGIYGYADTDTEYDNLVANWYRRRMHWHIESKHILKTPNVMFGIAAAIRAVTEPGASILICQPVYHPFAKIIPLNHRKTVVSELVFINGRYTIDFTDFEDKIRRNKVEAFLLCSPHNPVSRVWSKEELMQIAEICERHNVYVISDEIHADFLSPGHDHIPFASLSKEIADRTITCSAPTKTFNLAGLQAAHVVAASETFRGYIHRECAATGYAELNTMAIAAAKAAYRDGEPWLTALLQYLQHSMEMLYKAFPKDAPISVIPMEGTYLAWLDCRKLHLTPPALDDLFLRQAGVWLHNGATFGAGGEGFMRMNIACPHSVLQKAIHRIKVALDHKRANHL